MPETSDVPAIPLETLLSSIGSTTRWAILRELSDGGSLMVSELAQRLGVGSDVISKQVAFLRKAGIVINPRIRLLEIAPQFLADKSQRLLDFGWCLLRMNTGR